MHSYRSNLKRLSNTQKTHRSHKRVRLTTSSYNEHCNSTRVSKSPYNPQSGNRVDYSKSAKCSMNHESTKKSFSKDIKSQYRERSKYKEGLSNTGVDDNGEFIDSWKSKVDYQKLTSRRINGSSSTANKSSSNKADFKYNSNLDSIQPNVIVSTDKSTPLISAKSTEYNRVIWTPRSILLDCNSISQAYTPKENASRPNILNGFNANASENKLPLIQMEKYISVNHQEKLFSNSLNKMNSSKVSYPHSQPNIILPSISIQANSKPTSETNTNITTNCERKDNTKSKFKDSKKVTSVFSSTYTHSDLTFSPKNSENNRKLFMDNGESSNSKRSYDDSKVQSRSDSKTQLSNLNRSPGLSLMHLSLPHHHGRSYLTDHSNRRLNRSSKPSQHLNQSSRKCTYDKENHTHRSTRHNEASVSIRGKIRSRHKYNGIRSKDEKPKYRHCGRLSDSSIESRHHRRENSRSQSRNKNKKYSRQKSKRSICRHHRKVSRRKSKYSGSAIYADNNGNFDRRDSASHHLGNSSRDNSESPIRHRSRHRTKRQSHRSGYDQISDETMSKVHTSVKRHTTPPQWDSHTPTTTTRTPLTTNTEHHIPHHHRSYQISYSRLENRVTSCSSPESVGKSSASSSSCLDKRDTMSRDRQMSGVTAAPPYESSRFRLER